MNKIADTFLRLTVCAQEPGEVEEAFLGSIWTSHTCSGKRIQGPTAGAFTSPLSKCCSQAAVWPWEFYRILILFEGH